MLNLHGLSWTIRYLFLFLPELTMLLPLILASTSTQRYKLLQSLGIEPAAIKNPAIDEIPLKGEQADALATRLALQKAQAIVAQCEEESLILAGDTVVACGQHILPKAESAEMVAACLRKVSGHRIHVYSGVALVQAKDGAIVRQAVDFSKSWCKCKPLKEHEIAEYVATGDGIGIAGGCSIVEGGGAFFPVVYGSYSGIIGLPLYETKKLLVRFGYFPTAA